MLAPRQWPTSLWVATVPLGLLLLHAIGLGIQLAILESSGGIPEHPYAPGAPPVPAIYESYTVQAIGGFAPGVIALALGLYASITTSRRPENEVALWGRIFTSALLAVAVAIVVLSWPWITAPH